MSRLIAHWTIGNSSNVEQDRRIGWELKRLGWGGFVNSYVREAVDLGFTSFGLHNPFGTRANENMLASQAIAARNAGMAWLTDGFVTAWKPLASDHEVIAYMGSVKLDDSFKTAWERGVQEWAGYVHDAFNLPIQAGMSIALDSHVNIGTRSSTCATARMVEQMAHQRHKPVRMYFEPGPAPDDVWFKPGHSVWVSNANSRFTLGDKWYMDPLPEGTEIIVQITEPPYGESWDTFDKWIKPVVQGYFEQGFSVAVPPADFARFGWSNINQVVA